MKNLNFIRLYRESQKSLEGLGVVDYERVHNNIYSIYYEAKKEGLNVEQRNIFFNLIRQFNHKANNRIRSLRRQLRNDKTPIREYYDESELGAYAGSYIEGYEYNLTYEEKQFLKRSLEWFEDSLISFEGEIIPNDLTIRIPLEETERKIQLFEQIIDDDSIEANSVHIQVYTDIGSPDDLPF